MTSLNAAKIGLAIAACCKARQLRRRDDLRPRNGDRQIDLHEPFPYNEGIEYVIVNGQVVLDRGKHTDAMPGKALRRK